MSLAYLHILAARGDPQAQGALADFFLGGESGLPDDVALLTAEIYARLAAAHGRAEDRTRVAMVLMQLATSQCATAAATRDEGVLDFSCRNLAEGVAIFDQLAEEGDAGAEEALDRVLGEALRIGLHDRVRALANEYRQEEVVGG